jgi:hypothetical protein
MAGDAAFEGVATADGKKVYVSTSESAGRITLGVKLNDRDWKPVSFSIFDAPRAGEAATPMVVERRPASSAQADQPLRLAALSHPDVVVADLTVTSADGGKAAVVKTVLGPALEVVLPESVSTAGWADYLLRYRAAPDAPWTNEAGRMRLSPPEDGLRSGRLPVEAGPIDLEEAAEACLEVRPSRFDEVPWLEAGDFLACVGSNVKVTAVSGSRDAGGSESCIPTLDAETYRRVIEGRAHFALRMEPVASDGQLGERSPA